MASDVSKSGALKQSWRASAFASLQEFLAKFAPRNCAATKEGFKECCEQLSIQKACRVEASSELFSSSLWLFGTGGERFVARLGIGPLRCVLFGVCGSSVRTSEMFWTCGCFLQGTHRRFEKTWRQEFRHCLAKSSHGTISDGHFYEVILGEVWRAALKQSN